jgi:hypothetical protein
MKHNINKLFSSKVKYLDIERERETPFNLGKMEMRYNVVSYISPFGMLTYLANSTHSDIAFAMNILANSITLLPPNDIGWVKGYL